jgi:hypothetical protein
MRDEEILHITHRGDTLIQVRKAEHLITSLCSVSHGLHPEHCAASSGSLHLVCAVWGGGRERDICSDIPK